MTAVLCQWNSLVLDTEPGLSVWPQGSISLVSPLIWGFQLILMPFDHYNFEPMLCLSSAQALFIACL